MSNPYAAASTLLDQGNRLTFLRRFIAHEYLRATAVLVLALHISFFPFIWGDKTLLSSARDTASILVNGAWAGPANWPAFPKSNDPGAPAWQLEPYGSLLKHQYLTEHRLPLWNPYQAFGAPLAANMQSQVYNPLHILLCLNTTPRTFNFFILARFFIAGFAAFLFMRLFFPFVPAIAGGIAFMLSGYFLVYFNITHISVDMLVPAAFFAIERILRDASLRNVWLLSVITFLTIIGGMPECAFLVLSFSYVYFLVRLLVTRSLRRHTTKALLCVSAGSALGFALSAFLLLPFLEYLRLSFNTHESHNIAGELVGLRSDRLGLSIATYLAPLLFGPTLNPVPEFAGHNLIRGYFGITQVLFAVVALGGLFSNKKATGGSARFLTAFFALSAVLLLAKRYGAGCVNWIGTLPLFNLIWFPKYDEPLLAFAVSVLFSIGVGQVLSRAASRLRLTIAVLLIFVLLIWICVAAFPTLKAAKTHPFYFYLSMGIALTVLLAVVVVLFSGALAAGDTGVSTPFAAWGLVLVLTVEMASNFIYPTWYVFNTPASVEADPYRGAPYLDFLKSRMDRNQRIFARDGILFPNWASHFRILDVRNLDALYFKRYLAFTKAFFPPSFQDEMYDRFTGLGDYSFERAIERRYLQLSSVRYVLSKRPYVSGALVAREILDQNKGRLTPGREGQIELRVFSIEGRSEVVLFEHPVYERLSFKTDVTPEKREFRFSVAMDPVVYTGQVCGDGMEFRLEVREASGRVYPVYSRYIDPKHNVADRVWHPGRIDLQRYVGQTVELLFTTTAGPAGNSCMDWGGWGDLHFMPEGRVSRGAAGSFKAVYQGEIGIYDYENVLPRCAMYSRVECAADEAASLARLTSPSLDVFETAVVSLPDLTRREMEAVQNLERHPATRVLPARIVKYSSQEVVIDAYNERPCLLVLNDSNYPGWNAYVDGERTRWIPANYLFRGVFLRGGRHSVRFCYEPASFRYGVIVSGLGVAVAILVWRVCQRRRGGVPVK